MVEPLRHRQTKGAATDMPGLLPPRHIPTLPIPTLAIAEIQFKTVPWPCSKPGTGAFWIEEVRRKSMPRIKHIALTTKEPAKVAAFYKDAFGMQEIRRAPNGAVFLTDGYINLAAGTDDHFQRFCREAGRHDLADDALLQRRLRVDLLTRPEKPPGPCLHRRLAEDQAGDDRPSADHRDHHGRDQRRDVPAIVDRNGGPATKGSEA